MILKFFITVAFFYQVQFSQEIEVVVLFQGFNSKIARFEVNLIRDIIDVYNNEYDESIKLQYRGVKNIQNLLDLVSRERRDNVLALYQLSITKERLQNFDFSPPYLTNRFSLLSKNFIDKNKINYKVAYYSGAGGSVFGDMIPKLQKQYNYEFIGFSDRDLYIEALFSNKVDMIFTDFVEIWTFNLKLVNHVNKIKDQIGILFPKGSLLGKKINKIFKDYIKSKAYSMLIKNHFKSYGKYFQINN